MTARPWAPRPKAGDIVQCRFPESEGRDTWAEGQAGTCRRGRRGPGGRIGLDRPGRLWNLAGRRAALPGEFTIRATDPKAGLGRDTKFDLGNTVRLPFDSEWFAPSPNQRFGERADHSAPRSQAKNCNRPVR